jgi:hypothetical protein
MAKPVRAKFPPSFGVFSPTGHIVMAFGDDNSAEMAQRALLTRGFGKNEVTRYDKEDVILECKKSMEHASSPAQIGQDVAKIEEYLALAKKRLWISRGSCPRRGAIETRYCDCAPIRIEICGKV